MPTRTQYDQLLADPARVMGVIGEIAVARSKRSFKDQTSPDGEPWPHRYPNQSADFLNIAGAIEDLRSGPRIKKRRYDRRPAGRDTGNLVNSITFTVNGTELMVGSNAPYAAKFHFGGSSTQSLGGAVRANLKTLLGRQRKRRRRAGRTRQGHMGAASQSEGRTIEELRLGPLFGRTSWTTTSPPRPFVGLNDADGIDIALRLATLAAQLPDRAAGA